MWHNLSGQEIKRKTGYKPVKLHWRALAETNLELLRKFLYNPQYPGLPRETPPTADENTVMK